MHAIHSPKTIIKLCVIALVLYIILVLFLRCSHNSEGLPASVNPQDMTTVLGAIPYHICKTGPQKQDELSPEVVDLFQDITTTNPGISIQYFDDQDCAAYIEKYFDARVLNAYLCLQAGAYRADMFRYCFLFMDGGVYGDLTQKYYYPLTRFIDFDRDDLVLVRDMRQLLWPGAFLSSQAPPVQIAFMAARPRHPIFKHAIEKICQNVEKHIYGANPLYPTGPYMFGTILRDHGFPYRCNMEQHSPREYRPTPNRGGHSSSEITQPLFTPVKANIILYDVVEKKNILLTKRFSIMF